MTERPTGQPERRRRSEESVPFVITTVRIPEHQSILLGLIAKLEGVSASDIMRSAINDLLEKKALEYETADGKKATLGREMKEIIVYTKQRDEAKTRLEEVRVRLRQEL